MKNIIGSIICLFVGHNKTGNKCKRCGTEFGVPKMSNHPRPPMPMEPKDREKLLKEIRDRKPQW